MQGPMATLEVKRQRIANKIHHVVRHDKTRSQSDRREDDEARGLRKLAECGFVRHEPILFRQVGIL